MFDINNFSEKVGHVDPDQLDPDQYQLNITNAVVTPKWRIAGSAGVHPVIKPTGKDPVPHYVATTMCMLISPTRWLSYDMLLRGL